MKFQILLTLLICGAPASFAQQTGPDELYRMGKFAEAAGGYEEMIKTEPINPWLHYNLGNSNFKLGRTGKAVASYMRAFTLMPRNKDIRHNLDFALKRSGEYLVPKGVPYSFHYICHFFSVKELEGIVWISLWVSLMLAGICLMNTNARDFFLQPLVIFSFLALTFGAWRLMLYATGPGNPGVIIAGTAELRGGPGDNFPASATVPEGRLTEIISSKDDWTEIGIPREGLKGWIKTSQIEKLQP